MSVAMRLLKLRISLMKLDTSGWPRPPGVRVVEGV